MAEKYEFNYALCKERHECIGGEFEEMKNRLKRVENRAWIIMTLLLSNMVGIIFIAMFK